MSDSAFTYARHQLFLAELYRILEASVALGVEDFERRKRKVESYHLASYVRNETKARLADLRGTSLQCSTVSLSNNGLQIHREGDILKVRKKQHATMTLYGEPTPRQSGRMQAFFEQRPLDLFAPGSEEVIHVHGENLFVLWDFDFAAKRIGSVELVKPEVWCLAVPYPEITAEDDRILTNVDDLDDLELEREDDALELPDLELAKKNED